MSLGLKSLHDKKIVHRDIKSANVFVAEDGTYKLGDLNVAKVLKSDFAKTQIGTPFYTAPEIWREKPYGTKCDMWSLGCVIYEMAAGKPPFNASDLQYLYRKIVNGSFERIPRMYSEGLANVVSNLLKQVPQLRPSADEILSLKALQNIYYSNLELPKLSKKNSSKK